ncbi:MAG TPA: Firmicu-CTERM sorting domain-containing protein [Bacillota bacterium]|nr:Firmicu-CTERM sorting domain-containing protein [Bacillota bacterium]HNT02871.1 Firmicu-CTERM sorting domain-containing protein [Bacillota bacterium]HPA55354.1 Firmicu-CTERM sorting domain-containing protein [Bacillota bacterium]HPX69265.1 Firmicu-CTERM sorting domain-containing protein [Bacillota bacterium]HQA65158.1 Firmicu-CTERM sorting domain-containing protein [Bacillota bacterium]
MKKIIQKVLIGLLLIQAVSFSGYADYGSIDIDGYYDDWEDKPHTEVYYGKKPYVSEIHLVSVFRDETTVYVHIKMSENGYTELPNSYFTMDTDMGSEAFTLMLDSMKKKESGTAGIEVHLTDNWDVVGSGYYTREEGESDEAEFEIPLYSITDEPDGVVDIAIMFPDLGSQDIVCVGAGTGPYIAVAIGAVIVLLSLAYYYKKKHPAYAK